MAAGENRPGNPGLPAGLLRLARLRLALLNGAAALAGYLLFPADSALLTGCAVFMAVALMAAGGSALNQLLEVDLDRRMQRTRHRPLPAGQLTAASAAGIGGGLAASGLVLAWTSGGMLPTLLGAGALLWYLLVYTPLKRRSAFALLAGAICGALPPLIGWCVAGGQPDDYRIMLLAGLLYLWQIPHFWLFQRRHAEDYRSAGIPVVSCRYSGDSTALFCRLWIAALLTGVVLLPAVGIIDHSYAAWYAVLPLSLLLLSFARHESVLFHGLNLFPVMLAIFFLIQKIS